MWQCTRSKTFLLLLMNAVAFTIGAPSPNDYRLTILHTNDVHARFETFTGRGSTCKTPSTEPCYGGVARKAGFVAQMRSQHSNLLLLDAGDQFQGTPWYFTYKGRAASLFLNKLNYTAMALGNHEFDDGLVGLKEFLLNVSIPILCANLVIDDQVPSYIKDNVKKHIVVEVGGRKVGIIGYITHTVPTMSNTETLSFETEDAAIQREADILKAAGVNIIIAVGHAGLSADLGMAQKLTDVDVFVGAHSHSLLYTGTNALGDKVSGVYPEVLKHASGGDSLVVQAGSFGKYVGRLELAFDAAGAVSSFAGNPVLMNSTIPEDPQIKEEIVEMSKTVQKNFLKVLGTSAMQFDTSENVCRVRECELGNLYADAMMDIAASKADWAVNMALVNGGSLRASLDKGNITFGDAISVFPFNNEVILIAFTGDILKRIFERSAENFSLLDRDGKFLQVSGVKVRYDFTKPNGQRVMSIQVKNRNDANYQEYKPTDTYRAILQSFLARGGDGYTAFETVKDSIFNIDVIDVDIFIRYLDKHSPIKASLQGRILGMKTMPGWSAMFPGMESKALALKSFALSVLVPLVSLVLFVL